MTESKLPVDDSGDGSVGRELGFRGNRRLQLIVVALGIVAVALSVTTVRRARQALDRTEAALKLQVLASRLGAAAVLAEYDEFNEARRIMSGVFDGIRNHGIERGSLPEGYATVLEARDSVILGLDRRDEDVRGHLVELFFLLQLPADTRLDPDRIIPATDSGAGIAPPRRRPSEDALEPAIGDSVARTTLIRPDTGAAIPDTIG